MGKRELELILTSYNKIEERKFISEISDFAEKGKRHLLPAFKEILGHSSASLHLKYLVIKTIGVLVYPEFLPLLAQYKSRGEKIRIVLEAVRSLVKYDSTEAYRVIVDILKEPHNEEHVDVIEGLVKDMISSNPLLYYYDILYRQKYRAADDLLKGINSLAEGLETSELVDLSGVFETESRGLSRGLLMVMNLKPSQLFYANIYRYFLKRYKAAAEEEFRLICNCMFNCALLFGSRDKIFENLKKYPAELRGVKKTVFSILLLKFGKDISVDQIAESYSNLSVRYKREVFANLQYNYRGRDFARQQILLKSEESVMDSILDYLAGAGDVSFLCSSVVDYNEEMRVKVLDKVLSISDTDVSDQVADFMKPDSSLESARMVLKYILTRRADEYYDRVEEIWKSDVTPAIRATIIRNCVRFDPLKRENILEIIFNTHLNDKGNRKDLLISVSSIINSGEHDREFIDDIVHRILVLMEQAQADEVVNYIYFFDSTEIEDTELWNLIKDELRMVQNTLLVAHADDQLVRMIHYLIRKIDKNILLQK